jgi:DNA-damage-inducible protein J
MASDTVVRARIDSQVKADASRVLGKMGLTVSDAIRMMLVRVAAEEALPFPVKVPNAETLAAMAEADSGDLRSFSSVEEFMATLNAPD